MAIVNRTPDSFYDRGATFEPAAALERVARAIDEGADIVDIGGVKAGPGAPVDITEELRRTVDLVQTVRRRHPDIVISVDTWRHEVARRCCQVGADLINDAWGGYDPQLADVAAEFGVGLVCTHTGGLAPRTSPHRVAYAQDIVHTVRDDLQRQADRAEGRGVRASGILIDPGHDFGKNTWHSLTLTRRLDELVATGRPVLVSLSNKDFIGETLGTEVTDRLGGTLAATAVCAQLGARVFRAHEIHHTRHVLDMVATLRGERLPQRVVRGLA